MRHSPGTETLVGDIFAISVYLDNANTAGHNFEIFPVTCLHQWVYPAEISVYLYSLARAHIQQRERERTLPTTHEEVEDKPCSGSRSQLYPPVPLQKWWLGLQSVQGPALLTRALQDPQSHNNRKDHTAYIGDIP